MDIPIKEGMVIPNKLPFIIDYILDEDEEEIGEPTIYLSIPGTQVLFGILREDLDRLINPKLIVQNIESQKNSLEKQLTFVKQSLEEE